MEPRLVMDSTTVFNEIMYNPAGPDESAEWIELYNQLSIDMDLSEWELRGGVDYTIPDGTIIPARGYVVIASDPAELEAATGLSNVLGPFSGQLNDGGEELLLYNNDGRRMNVVEYGDNGDWPVAPDGSGASLAKLERTTNSEHAENWVASPQVGGTPGFANFDSESTFVQTTLLDQGVPVRAFVPTSSAFQNTWFLPDFDDSSWLSGTTGVGYDTGTNYNQYLGLDFDAPPNGQAPMPMQNVNSTAYIRLEFELDDDIDLSEFDALFLGMQYDDGFVAYLNGTEVARSAGLPANPAWNSTAPNNDDGQAVNFVNFDITAFDDLLNTGRNVLAIHGVNQAIGSSDFLIQPVLRGAREISGSGGVELPAIALNEIAPATSDEFFIEIVNEEDSTVDLSGYVLTSTGLAGGSYTFPDQTSVSAGGLLSVTAEELGFQPADGEKVFLYTAEDGYVVDGRVVTGRLRGRSAQHDGRWLYPDVATPGGANSFQFQEDVVINEIMYHAFPTLATSSTPFAESDEEWIELYNRGASDVDLSGWTIEDAVEFEFPAGTTIPPDSYLVISGDATSLRLKYPAIADVIVGDFSGSLRNSDDRIRLLDANENPADDVHYHDAGQWPTYADGGGSTLELRDPRADNSVGAAWAASDEASKSEWVTYTFQDLSREPLDCCGGFNEFIFGLLDSGEFLIDDISVVGNPSSTRVQMMQNGTFEGDAIGASPAAWRVIGTHQGTVVADPDDPDNHVLHVVADGTQTHVHDHAETTFAGNQSVTSYSLYEFSFRAKWLGGNSQLNTRLYFTRASNTTKFAVPEHNGTPGAENSAREENVGPTYTEFGHRPILPSVNQPVTVSVRAEDPDSVDLMRTFYRVNGGAWNTVAMTASGEDGVYTAQLPGQSFNAVVQFYVEGRDPSGALSTFPARGADSRALYQVSGPFVSRPNPTLRLVLNPADNNNLFSAVNRMSNAYSFGTLVLNDDEIFYDVGIRQTGSRWIRPNSGYKVRMDPEQKYYGVHDSIRLDINNLVELLYKQMVNRAGGSEVSMYDDVANMISPQHGERKILLNLARYENIFLDEQFENGSDGTKWELDDITYPTGGAFEGLKDNTGVSRQDWLFRQSVNPDDYRGQLLIKNQRARDDYRTIVDVALAMFRNGQQMYDATNAVMDVDLWMRHYATQAYLGNWDTYGFLYPKNLRIYKRPSDGLVIPLFWDADLANLTEPIIHNGGTTRLDEMRNLPPNTRLFWGHMWDLMNRSFNSEYAAYWHDYYASVGATSGPSISLALIGTRTNQARQQAMQTIAPTPFRITTNGGNGFSVDHSAITLQGDGWINVREIMQQGREEPLDVIWTDQNSWSVTVPLEPGENEIVFTALDFEGNPACDDNPACSQSTVSITMTSTDPLRPVRDFLRINEIMYNPSEPTDGEVAAGFDDADDFEYVELVNTSDQITLDLAGTRFSEGIDFEFPAGSMLAPGQLGVIVRNAEAFALRYGEEVDVIGQYDSNLSNGGERLTVLDADGLVAIDFAYSDGGNWPGRPDGSGSSLQVVDAAGDYTVASNWRASVAYHGTPGAVAMDPTPRIVVNEVLSHTDDPQWDSIELLNVSAETIDISGWYLSDSNVYRKFAVPAGTVLQPGDYKVFDELDFNPTPEAPGPGDFALNGAHGDDVWLLATDAEGNLAWFADHAEFGAQANGESWGRWPDGLGLLYPSLTMTLGGENDEPRVGPLVITEIMYNAPDPDLPDEGIDPADLQFVEILNPTDAVVDLTNWRIASGIDLEFEPGTEIGPGEVIVVVDFDPVDPLDAALLADFRSVYGIDESVRLVGNFAGQLSNGGETVRLLRPDQPPVDEPDFYPLLLEDEVRYDDEAPWPVTADGGGDSLTRLSPTSWGIDAASWVGSTPTPGSVTQGPPTVISVLTNADMVDPPSLPSGPQPSSWKTQTSDLRSIVIQFSAPVTASATDLTLTNLGLKSDEQTPIDLNGHFSVSGNTVTLSFGADELDEGVYQLEILPTLTGTDGEPLDGDGDGEGGDGYVVTGSPENRLFRLIGNWAPSDTGVSIFDFTVFAYWFGQPVAPLGVPGAPGAPDYVNIERDDGISIFDFTPFSTNFGAFVEFPPPPLNDSSLVVAPAGVPVVSDTDRPTIRQSAGRKAVEESAVAHEATPLVDWIAGSRRENRDWARLADRVLEQLVEEEAAVIDDGGLV